MTMRNSGQPTINDVARLAGVSKKTVSRVINRSPLLAPDTRARVEAVIGDLGYSPNPQARALALRRSFLIALVHDNPNPYFVMDVQGGMLEALAGTDFELLVRPLERGDPDITVELRRFLDRQRPFGVVLLPPLSENDALAQLCADSKCRYVRLGSAPLDSSDHLVASNDREAVRNATAYLLALGHRRIGLIAGPPGFRSATERRAGLEDALTAVGLDLPDDRVAPGDYTFDSGLRAGRHLLAGVSPPTALIACNDEMAAGALHAAHALGLAVPRDLSVIGFDDSAIAAHVWPPLTTIRWPAAAMARAAAAKLIAPADPPDPAEAADLFRLPLIRRATVAPPSG